MKRTCSTLPSLNYFYKSTKHRLCREVTPSVYEVFVINIVIKQLKTMCRRRARMLLVCFFGSRYGLVLHYPWWRQPLQTSTEKLKGEIE
jgi:hypothetical protein